MANIAFIQNKLGKTDGVSLEVDKWRSVLEGMGHTVFYCAGNDDVDGVHTIPELSLFHPVTNKILKNGTVELKDYATADIQLREALADEKTNEYERASVWMTYAYLYAEQENYNGAIEAFQNAIRSAKAELRHS